MEKPIQLLAAEHGCDVENTSFGRSRSVGSSRVRSGKNLARTGWNMSALLWVVLVNGRGVSVIVTSNDESVTKAPQDMVGIRAASRRHTQ